MVVIVNFTTLILEFNNIFFHLFVLKISFIGILQFSEYKYFISLLRFVPKYCTLFDEMVNGTVSLISLSNNSLLAYRNARDFCISIWYPANLLNSLISSNSFLVASLGFPMYSITLPANSDSLTSSFLIWISFLFLLWLLRLGLPKLSWIKLKTEDTPEISFLNIGAYCYKLSS